MQATELTPHQKAERYYTAVTAETCRRNLRKFIRRVWPLIDPKPYVEAWHIDAICLPGNAVITTEFGQIRIAALVDTDWEGRVLSYNHATGQPEWRRVLRKMRTPPQGLLTITIDRKRKLTITGNHPVWVQGHGYVRADEVQAGQEVCQLRSVWGVVSPQTPHDPVLQSQMLRTIQDVARAVRMPFVRQAEGLGKRQVHEMQGSITAHKHGGALSAMRKAGLQIARAIGRQFEAAWSLLRPQVPCVVHAGEKQSGVHPRAPHANVFTGISPRAFAGARAGSQPVFPLYRSQPVGGASHRLGQAEQWNGEFGDAVPYLPHRAARGQDGGRYPQIISGTVTRIERSTRLCDHLYNLDVQGNHNYFAQGVLVHNCDHLAYVAIGDIQNLMINIGPRMTKSSVVSVAFPAWMWTDEDNAAIQFLCASYAKDLAEGDAIKMRRIVESTWYKQRYPHVMLLGDQNRADDFRNTLGGYRQSISVGGRTTGMGGDIQILDDAHNAATIEHDAVRKAAVHWYDNAWRSRVNDPNNARRVCCGQRTHDGDVYGHVLGREEKRWVHLNLPMEFDESRRCITYRNKGEGNIGEPIFRDPRTKPNALMCPERFDEKAATAEKEAIPKRTWDSQYNQQPEGKGGVILKRKWWRRWEWPEWHPKYRKEERPLPEILQVIQAYDTAFEDSEQDSFTVRTTWGLFEHADTVRMSNGQTREMPPRINGILLERRKWRPSFGELRDDAVESAKQFNPDRVLVEKKASGHCYSDDTEVLTRRGWVRFVDINIASDWFATRNPVTKAFEWQQATAQIRERYSGEMVHFHGRAVDALVTPNHRMLIDSLPRALGGNHRRKGEILVEAKRLVGLRGGKTLFPMTSLWHGTEIGPQSFPICQMGRSARFKGGPNLKWLTATQEALRKGNCATATERTVRMSGDDYCAFMGAFLSEGWSRVAKNNKGGAVHISQRKTGTEAFRAFEELLSKILGKPVRHDGTDFVIARLGLVEHVRLFGDRAWNKFVPEMIMGATPRQLLIFWNYYMLGDGHRRGRLQSITTTSKRMAGQLMEIAQKLGYSASVYARKGLTRDRIICNNKRPTLVANCHLSYVVRLRYSHHMGFHTRVVPYEGTVHCVQVPNGVLYVSRNGKPLWCGNSLVQELRRKNLPVRAVKIQGDLIYRAHMAALPLEKGSIWYLPRNWALALIETAAKFPNVDFDDEVASCVIAWQYMRRFMDLQLDDDDDTEELELFNPATMRPQIGFYG